MKILGIDPGYGITGFGLIDAQRGQYRLLGCGAITTPPNTDFPWRLEVIYNDMTQLLQTAQQGNKDFFYILIVIVRGYRVSIDNGMILQVVSLRACV